MMETVAQPPKLVHLFTLHCGVSSPVVVGEGPYGLRRCVPITSGTVKGPHLEGEVLPGGADFMLTEQDQTTHVNARYVVKTKEDAYIYINTEGTRSGPPEVLQALMAGGPVDPSDYWFHLHVKIEAGHEKYRWMNNRVIVGRAVRSQTEVAYDAYYLENTF